MAFPYYRLNDADSRAWFECCRKTREPTVHELLERLDEQQQALEMQALGTKHDEEEQMMHVRMAVTEKDRAKAKAALRLTHEYKRIYESQQNKRANLIQIRNTLLETMRNVENAHILKASSLTLSELNSAVETFDVTELQVQMQLAQNHDEEFAQFDLQDVDDELDALFDASLELPDVSNRKIEKQAYMQTKNQQALI